MQISRASYSYRRLLGLPMTLSQILKNCPRLSTVRTIVVDAPRRLQDRTRSVRSPKESRQKSRIRQWAHQVGIVRSR